MALNPSSLGILERYGPGMVEAPTCGRPTQVCSLMFSCRGFAQKSFFNTNVLCKKFFNSAVLGSAQCPPGGALPGTDGRPAPGPHRDQRMEPDLEALMSLPSVPYEACDRQPGRVSSLSMARYKTNDCRRCSGGNSLLSAALPEARTKRSGSSLTSCRSCLVRLC